MKNKLPCKGHKIAFPNNTMPETAHFKLVKCPICGWFVKETYLIDEKEFNKLYF